MQKLKSFTVTAGDPKNPVVHNVTINGVTVGTPLSPTIARQAAVMAVGHCLGVSVSSDDGHWYRLYSSRPGKQRRYSVGPRRPVGRPRKENESDAVD